MDVTEEATVPSAAALETLRHAAKLGLRLSWDGARLVYKCEQRMVGHWVSAQLDKTRDELAALVLDLGQANDCLVPLRPVARPEANLVCVHPANAASFIYHHLALSIDDRYSVYGCDALDGLFSRRPDASLEAMTNHYIRALGQSPLSRMPLALYGGSSGGVVVLEMARKMAAAGSPPVLVVLGDTRDPLTSAVHAHYRRDRLAWNAFIEALFPTEMWDVPPDHMFWRLAESGRLDYLRDRLIPLLPGDGILAALDPSLIPDYFAAFRRYMNCYGEYVPKPYFGRALFLKASQAPRDATSTMISMLQGEARVQMIEGIHHSFHAPPVASAVSEAISRGIAEYLTA